MGAGVSALLESPAAGSDCIAIGDAVAGVAARNPHDRRYFLSQALGGCRAGGPPIARGGGDGKAVFGVPSGTPAALAMGGAEFGRRIVPGSQAVDRGGRDVVIRTK